MTFRSRVPLRASLLIAFLALALSQTGCPSVSNLSAIQSSALAEQDKAAATLFEIESSWVNAKSALADALVELQAAGIQLPQKHRARLRMLVHAGNAAVDSARLALARGDTSTAGPGLLSDSLRLLRDTVEKLRTETGRL